MIAVSHISDKMKIRSPFIFSLQFITLVGYVIEISSSPSGVKYFGTFLCVIGSYTGVPCSIGWWVCFFVHLNDYCMNRDYLQIRLANNINGRYKRAVGLALQGCIGNFGGIIASNIFLTKDEPRYIPGRESSFSSQYYRHHANGHIPDSIEVGISGAGMLVTVVTAYTFHRLNSVADERGEEDNKVASASDIYVI